MTDPLRTLLTQKSLEDFYELLADLQLSDFGLHLIKIALAIGKLANGFKRAVKRPQRDILRLR